jgi:uncharacterized protein YndB with AHSA1/START domain
MIPMQSAFPSTTPDCEIVSVRTFASDIETLFETWANPELLQQWWGPAGFTNTFHVFDFQVGGTWIFTMHGPEKGNYQNECIFTHIERPAGIAWRRVSMPHFLVVATFESLSQTETQLVFRMIFETAAECDKLRKFVPDKNEENFDRLEAVIRQLKG